MKRYKVRNWEKYQHYKKRNPPWIKLHLEILTSKDWVMLADASRVLAIACMLLASKNDGYIPDDPEYLKRVAYLNTEPDFTQLIECGFLIKEEDASKMLANASISVSVSEYASDMSLEGGVGETTAFIASDNIFQDLPAVLATDSFKSEWRSWETYLRKTHRTLQPIQRLPAWLNLLERAPPGGEVAFGITTIRQAMAAGWKNLYPQEEKKHERTSVHRRDPSKSAGGGRYEGIKPKINGFPRSIDRPADTGQTTPIQRDG